MAATGICIDMMNSGQSVTACKLTEPDGARYPASIYARQGRYSVRSVYAFVTLKGAVNQQLCKQELLQLCCMLLIVIAASLKASMICKLITLYLLDHI